MVLMEKLQCLWGAAFLLPPAVQMDSLHTTQFVRCCPWQTRMT